MTVVAPTWKEISEVLRYLLLFHLLQFAAKYAATADTSSLTRFTLSFFSPTPIIILQTKPMNIGALFERMAGIYQV